jgi:Cof subfamily protein (haloacid dehalogenase superfamily)
LSRPRARTEESDARTGEPGPPGGYRLPPGFPVDVDLLACDLDRTLIAEDVVLRPRTRRALRAALAAGIRVLVVTGRMFQSVRPYVLEAGIEDPVVCYQGAVVADPRTGEFLRHEPIPLELAREAVAAIEAEGFQLNVYVDDELYVARATPDAERYAGFQNLELHEVGDVLAWLERPPTKLVSIGDPDALDGLEERMKRAFGDRLFIARSLPYFLEFAQAGVTKGTGLRFAVEHLGLSLERTVGFGDGENDVELLETAGYGVAVETAHPRLHAVADAFCPPAEEEGVAQVIEAYLASRSS